jgi:hypothetical protein
MGRGLSELQKTMLGMAMNEYEIYRKQCEDPAFMASPTTVEELEENNRIAPNWNGWVDFSAVFVKVYGWVPGRNGRFPKQEIGPKRYVAAKIAVRKSALRLARRGLIYISGSKSYALTSKGKAILLAKPVQ